MKEMGLTMRRKKHRKQTTDSEHPFPRYPNLVKDLVVMHPNQAWVCDITYVKLGDGAFVYLAIVLDVFTRAIRGWALSHGLGVSVDACRIASRSDTRDTRDSPFRSRFAIRRN